MSVQLDQKATTVTRQRYQRIAPFYNLMESMSEKRYHPWRQQLWSLVQGPRVLEVGIGTGKNIAYYPKSLPVMAIDLTPGMLKQAGSLAKRLGVMVDLHLMDVQALGFPDASFDTVVATCVFCSVPDPVLGLKEVLRVTRPGGQVLLMEHVRSEKRLVGILMDLVNPLVVRAMGPNINRRTVDHVRQAGLAIERVETLGMGGVFKLIRAVRS